MRGVLYALLAALVLATSSAARPAQLQHVVLIGDSVADAIPNDSRAVALLSQGVDLELQVAPCRRLDGEGCPYQGVRPPSAVQLIQSMGAKLGPNVVMSVGYNDFEDQYAGNIDDALKALKAAGVKHVYWLTLRAAHHPYVNMNDDIDAAAQKHPEMTVVDWNVYSRNHPDWFQDDGLHLLATGAEQMASFVHKALVGAHVATPPARVLTIALPPAHRGKPYKAKLRAAGGVPPYRWSLLERAPAGVHLQADGAVLGRPRAKAGRYAFNVQVRDAAGSMTAHRLTLRVSP
jgi:hypothetical protein